MKTILQILLIVCSSIVYSQVGINTTEVKDSEIMTFPLGTNKGLVLPIVEYLPNTPVNGTLLMDKTDATFKMFENNKWVSISFSGSIDKTLFNTNTENTESGIIVGVDNSISGALVLESTSKALVLPKIASPELNVNSPPAGFICYDTVSKSIAMFNGINWNYLN